VKQIVLTAADIVSLDFELIVYRKGSLHAHVNLARGYLTWRDSLQWCNNFTRTISDDQAQEIRDLIQTCGLSEVQAEAGLKPDPQEQKPEQPGFDPVSWLITVHQSDETWQVRGYGSVPDCWQPLKELIEKISRICFFI
jgi:hypothetical protein